MPTPKSHEQELCEMFDSYSRRTILNLGMYVRRKYFTHKNRFTATDPQILDETEASMKPTHPTASLCLRTSSIASSTTSFYIMHSMPCR